MPTCRYTNCSSHAGPTRRNWRSWKNDGFLPSILWPMNWNNQATKKMLADQLKQLSLARQLGIKTAVGTGAGSIGILHGESMVEEMKLFIKAGYSLEETIQCASKNGAEFFGMEKLGRLTVGQKATFLITRGTVQQLPRKLSYLEGIYVDGAPSSTYSKNPVRMT